MAFTLSATIGLSGNGTLNLNAGVTGRVDTLNLGQSGFTIAPVNWAQGSPGSLSAAGALQSKNWCAEKLTISSSGSYSFCFNGGSDLDPSGAALAMTAVTLVMLAVIAIAGQTTVPDGADYLKLGPNAVSNAAQLWFGGAGSGMYETVYWQAWHVGPAAGWTVNSSTASLMPIANPGANAITAALLVIGAP